MSSSYSSKNGYPEITQLLLSQGAEINATPAEYYGRTALQAASEAGHLEIVQLLLEKGADVNAEPAEDYGRTALQAASEAGHLEIVQLLLSQGANINAKPATLGEGRTALQAASETGRLEIVQLLLRQGADVNAEPAEDYGRTALQQTQVISSCGRAPMMFRSSSMIIGRHSLLTFDRFYPDLVALSRSIVKGTKSPMVS
jgi:ankyrin repeat protein